MKYLDVSYLKIMIIALGFCLFGGHAQAQTYGALYTIPQKAKKVQVNKGMALEQALGKIEQKFNVVFLYRTDAVEDKKATDTYIVPNDVERALGILLENQNLSFKYLNPKTYGIYSVKERGAKNKVSVFQQVSGVVTDAESGETLPGVNVVLKGTSSGTATNVDGEFSLDVPSLQDTLVFSFIGYQSQEVSINGRTRIDVSMETETFSGEELLVVGYGVQQKSDITGSVSSVSQERLESIPSVNISQTIQGAVPGVMVQTSSAGAAPSQELMVRGRNSITASNEPLIVVDGISYSGNISDINPNEVESIEILKDASAAAIYGSRGSNGVILITTKTGVAGSPKISYDGNYSIQSFTNLPDVMDGAEFYEFKMERYPEGMTQEEEAVYQAGEWVDWYDLALQNGTSHQHNLSVSGGFENTTYYISGSLLNVEGLELNDSYQRVTSRINIESQFTDWFSIGTRTHLSYDDQSGVGPGWGSAYSSNPLVPPYDEDGNITSWVQQDPDQSNPLQSTLFDNLDESYQIVTDNFAIIDVPFIPGLSYKLNTGVRIKFSDIATYRGRNTSAGLEVGGSADTERSRWNSTVIENIVSYKREIGNHSVFGTAVYSFEKNSNSSNTMSARGFPNDFLTYYASEQAEFATPGYSYYENELISQMLRLNYSFDSRYLVTLTVRRDGYSGFGAQSKWGIFPSVALGWNIADEEFFPWGKLFDELKPRLSYGLSGNQAVGAYESISRLGQKNTVDEKVTQPGYYPTKLGQNDLGWESSRTINIGLDFGMLESRITGDINLYHTNTTDLLLNRTISSVHGITSIIENIGETENRGFELSLNSKNIVTNDFSWSTLGNISFVRNKILDLYGDGRDDVANGWFIGQPIRINYFFERLGTWQLDEANEAAEWGSQPGFVKLRDVDGDGELSADEDMQILGQQDPKFMWGFSNSFSYKNLGLNIFIHGVHGVTRVNELMHDDVTAEVRSNTVKKNWWTPDNPTNEWVMNHLQAEFMGGVNARRDAPYLEDASFIRIKDISLSYNFPNDMIRKYGLNRLRLYVTGRNLYTFTEWSGLDPELGSQRAVPLQREIIFGVNVGL